MPIEIKEKWKCAYCSRGFVEHADCTAHEVECIYNPETKRCETCKHLYWEYGDDRCAFDHEPKYFSLWAAGVGGCDKWEQEETE